MPERKIDKEKLIQYINSRLSAYIGATAETEFTRLRFKIEIGDFDAE